MLAVDCREVGRRQPHWSRFSSRTALPFGVRRATTLWWQARC